MALPGFSDIIARATKDNPGFLRDLVAALWDHGRHDELLDVCTLILRDAPDDLPASLLSVRALAAQGRIEQALERLLAMRQRGLDGDEVVAELRAQLVAAAAVHGSCLQSGAFERAVQICDLLAQLCPGVFLFQKARLDTRAMLQRQHATELVRLHWEHLNALVELASACQQQQDMTAELQCRLDIYRHPLDGVRHSVFRVQNLAAALRLVLNIDTDVFDTERLCLARELLAAIRTVPVTPAADDGTDEGEPACWEHFQRRLLATIDLDTVFGPPVDMRPPLPITFVSSAGVPMDLPAVTARSRELDARVVFATSASEEYFFRYARTYVSSILAACDCNAMIFICLCAPQNQTLRIVSDLGINDPRLIYYSDNFDPNAQDFTIFRPSGGKPVSVPAAYYASAALLHMDHLLQHLRLPVFVTGIDTVLQRGVADLIERFRQADVVFNRAGPHFDLGCQLVNNLVLTYPTANGLLFVQFLKTYLGSHLAAPVQATFLDQLDLHMARHHVIRNGVFPVIGYFDELDINIAMFNRLNYRAHLDKMRSYRFLNMFVGAFVEERLTAEDVATEDPPGQSWPDSRQSALAVVTADTGPAGS